MNIRIWFKQGGYTEYRISRFADLDAWLKDIRNVLKIEQITEE